MKAPLNWLKEYVDIECTAGELAEKLTFSGLEVEGVEFYGSDFKGIVAAEILDFEPHPSAEGLLVCSVFDGQRELKAVCGAHNFAAGDKVPLAAAGTSLPDGRKIERISIGGTESEGMLCAEDELGLSEDHSGLMLLPRETPAGTPLAEITGPPEPVLNIEVTPNRGDCLSMIGIAREIAALYGSKLKLPETGFHETARPVGETASVQVEDPEACPRYTARVVSEIKLAAAPAWMRRRLLQCGIRPINNAVDITNYLMMECGQPLHAFDMACVKEGRIIVRRARAGEPITTLDDTVRNLTPEMLVIADSAAPVALAGVMGGASSCISASTGTVLLESACFKPALIRKASKLLGLFSESSRRFEHGVDIEMVEWASRRAAALLASIAGGSVAKGVIDVFAPRPELKRITCRFDRVRKLLGIEITGSRITDIFKALELEVAESGQEGCAVTVPTFRPDLEGEADLIEEVARIHGLEKIPGSASKCTVVPDADDARSRAVMICRSRLCGLGVTEIVNYSFLSDSLLDLFDSGDAARRVILPRPISAEHSVLRNSLLPQLGDTLRRNCSRQTEEAALFELGRVFFKDGKRLREEERLAMGIMGPVGRAGLDKRATPSEEDMFLWLKGIFEGLCESLGLIQSPNGGAGSGISYTIMAPDAPARKIFPAACMEEDRSVAILVDGREVGVIGLLKQSIRGDWRLRMPVALLEVTLEPLLQKVFTTKSAAPLPVYPSVRRDVALVVDQAVTHESVLLAIRKIAPKELTGTDLFDIYHSKDLGRSRKGMAYSLEYRSLDRTLTDDEVNELHAAIKTGIKTELHAEIREG